MVSMDDGPKGMFMYCISVWLHEKQFIFNVGTYLVSFFLLSFLTAPQNTLKARRLCTCVRSRPEHNPSQFPTTLKYPAPKLVLLYLAYSHAESTRFGSTSSTPSLYTVSYPQIFVPSFSTHHHQHSCPTLFPFIEHFLDGASPSKSMPF